MVMQNLGRGKGGGGGGANKVYYGKFEVAYERIALAAVATVGP